MIGIGMLGSQVEQPSSARRGRGWMWGIRPVDQKRHQAVAERDGRIGQTPREHRAIGLLPARLRNRTKEDASAGRRRNAGLQVLGLRRPSHQARCGQRIDTKDGRNDCCGSPRIRSENLQIGPRSEREDGVVRTPLRMPTPDGGPNAQTALEVRHG